MFTNLCLPLLLLLASSLLPKFHFQLAKKRQREVPVKVTEQFGRWSDNLSLALAMLCSLIERALLTGCLLLFPTFTDTEVKIFFGMYYTQTTKKEYIPKNGRELNCLRAILSPRLLGGDQYSLITFGLANQRA